MHPSDLRARLVRLCSAGGTPSSDYDLSGGLVRPQTPAALRDAGVLIAILDGDHGPQVILTKRSSALKHHPGQIAFAGGKVDPTDADAIAAALREAHEEIALPPQNVEVLGCLPPHETGTGFLMTPVVGYVKGSFTPRAEPGEVDEIFMVPFAHLANPDNYLTEGRHFRGAFRQYYVVPYGPYYIWGATARILRALAIMMAAQDEG